jgi:hypothetical protein
MLSPVIQRGQVITGNSNNNNSNSSSSSSEAWQSHPQAQH